MIRGFSATLPWLLLLTGALTWTVRPAGADDGPKDDQVDAYVRRFLTSHPVVANPPAIQDYAAVQAYDLLHMSPEPCVSADSLNNDDGFIAWNVADRIASLNEMFRATGDEKYLGAALRCARAVLQARDDVTGARLANGETAPVWGSSKYTRGKRTAHLVHTAQIAAPIFDMILLSREHRLDLVSRDEEREMLRSLGESLDYHGRRWRRGPAEGEGYYREDTVQDPGPQPANALSAAGAALWLSWKASADTTHRDRALAIGRFLKARLILDAEDFYRWPYRPPMHPGRLPDGVPMDDVAHGAAVLYLPALLASAGEVFDGEDMARLGRTVLRGFARLDNGVLFGAIDGRPSATPAHVRRVALWLRASPQAPEIYRRIGDFFVRHVPEPEPLDLSLLIRYRPDAPR